MPLRSLMAGVETIRSRDNARLKDLRRRLSSSGISDGLVPIECDHLVHEAVRSGLRLDTIFIREDRAEEIESMRPNGNPRIFLVAPNAFSRASATEAPQGIAALVEAPQWRVETLLKAANPILLVLAGLQDPGNAGTIVRTAEAFGATGIFLTRGSVSPWNQKALRASAGSSFRLPVVQLESESTLDRLRELRIPLYATSAHGEISLRDSKIHPPVAVVIGNEGAGIPEAVLRHCSKTIGIPYSGPVESLNAAIAAAIVLYEISQREPSSAGEKA